MDIAYLLLLQEFREITNQVLNNLFIYITSFGDDFVIMCVIAGIYWCVNKRTGMFLMLNFHAANVVNQLIKVTACVYRPWVRDRRVIPVGAAVGGAAGYSFPSGHTAKALAVWGGLGWKSFRDYKSLYYFGVVLVLLVGFSRNYLGVHTPQDVLISLLLGVIITWGIECFTKYWDENTKSDWVIVITGGILAIFLVLYSRFKSYPIDIVNGAVVVEPSQMMPGCFKAAGGVLGALLGIFIERKWIGFDESNGEWKGKLLRFLVGAGVLCILFKTFPGFASDKFGRLRGAFAYGFLIPFFIVAIVPAFVKIFQIKKRRWGICAAGVLGIVYVGGLLGAVYQRPIAVYAHRGDQSSAPENTLPAFEAAILSGSTGIELDVTETRDGVLVVLHDDNLSRVTGVDANIWDLTYAELCELDAGSYYSPEFAGTKIPTLEEVLDSCGGEIELNVEIKYHGHESEDFIPRLVGVLQEKAIGQFMVTSFHYDFIKMVKALDSQMKTGFITAEQMEQIEDYEAADCFSLQVDLIDQKLVSKIHKMGKEVHVWTVNDYNSIKKCEDMGVDGIIGNDPRYIRSVLVNG